ncbi:MAG: methyl-accepting chemotaxis protein [Proteobacteria bacterium]|nr:methyl-accepting chemotaxis protein [Pseudomonadota bacterium]MCP4917857.1 methyl-accepting chemotaxis protein [Pseudomonadota bacterium]
MSRWKKALAKAGLLELDGDEIEPTASEDTPADADDIDRILAETKALVGDAEAAPPVVVKPTPPKIFEPLVEVVENVELDALFAQSGVPESPFPAEKLLKVLDGLRALDPGTRKAAILAMDAADEDWTIQDPLLDANRKIAALDTARERLTATAAQAEAKAETDLAEQETYKEEASATIRAQIADLEKLLETELNKVAEEKATIHARLQETRAACTRESARYEAESDRLKSLTLTFPTES